MNTTHFTLRDFNEGDINSLVKHANNINVSRYLTSMFPHPYTLEDAKWWISTGSKELGIPKVIDLNGECIGCVGYIPGEHDDTHSAQIGYWLGEEHWGKGIVTKALTQMTEYVFSNTDIVRLHAGVFSPNKASMRVLEKCGYKKEAVLTKALYKDGEYYDEHIFVLLNL